MVKDNNKARPEPKLDEIKATFDKQRKEWDEALREIQSKGAILNEEIEARRLSVKNQDEENEACRKYLANTSPSEWSYKGWVAYWLTTGPRDVHFYFWPHYVDEERFEELKRRERTLLRVEAPRTDFADEEVETASRKELDEALAREKEEVKNLITNSDWYKDPENKDLTKPFFWHGKLEQLAECLRDKVGIPTRVGRNDKYYCRWELVDGLFFDKNGKAITEKRFRDAESRSRTD